MKWRQQYGRYCRDCEFWDGIPYRSRQISEFKGIQGTCHRMPPLVICADTGQCAKPVTLDADGCGEFKRVWHTPAENESAKRQPEQTVATDVPKTESDQGLLKVGQIADLLGISRSSIYSMRSCGALPLAIRISGTIRWNKREILDWIEEGCPPRRKWEIIRKPRKY